MIIAAGFVMIPAFEALSRLDWRARKKQAVESLRKNRELARRMNLPQWSGLLTWSEIWCDVENSKSFRSSRDRRISPGHRLKGASALHNFLASIFTAPSVTTWSDMSGNTRKSQVTRLVTLRHRSTMSGVLGLASTPRR